MILVYSAEVTPLAEPTRFARYYEQLSPDRREKVDRARQAKDKRLSLGAAILLDRGLAPYRMREMEMHYDRNGQGKPSFRELPSLHFSLSHAGERVLAVFADRPVGCDLEKVGGFDPRLPGRFFCPAETERIRRAQDPADRAGLFFRFWVLKESFVKAVGLGFSLPFNRFEITLGETGATVAHSLPAQDFCFTERTLPGGYFAAVCDTNGETVCDWREISLAD